MAGHYPYKLMKALCVGFVASTLALAAAAQDGPPASLGDIHRVEASQTPSGFQVPRFVSLKFSRVNARTGPSRNHEIAYQYRRRGLPLVVVAETEMWRKVRDIHGDEAWVRKPALSGERYAMLIRDADLTVKAGSDSRRIARLAQGLLIRIESCERDNSCRVRTLSGMKGFAPRDALWGAQTLD